MEWQDNGYWIVTGATGGIGRAICRELVVKGYSVVATCRNRERGSQLVAELRQVAAGNADVRCEVLRLDDCHSVHNFAQRMKGVRIASLINNAGVMCRHYSVASIGIEQTMAVNCIGTVLLARLLLPMIANGGSMVFTTSITRRLHHITSGILSPTEKEFSQLGTYGRSKLALTHYAMHLADEVAGRVRVNCADVLFRPFISSTRRGAQSALQAAMSPHSGMIYYHSHFHPIEDELHHDASHRQLIAAIDEQLRLCDFDGF